MPDTGDGAPPLRVQKALHLARLLQQRATELQTPAERRQQAELDRMIQHPADKATLVQLTDQAFRARESWRSVDQMVHVLDVQGIPRFFSTLDRTMLRGFQSFGGYLPGVAVPLVKAKMHQETANVVLPAEPDMLHKHLQRRRDEGVRMNVNYLGEAMLGETQAEHRFERYLAALQAPDIEVISVKISTIYSQISLLGRKHTLRTLCDRLELLYRAAAEATFTRGDGTVVPKFVYLDMEEYRDLTVTSEAFMRTLDRPGLAGVSAGIALQAYIPDSFTVQRRITEWARRRVESGGGPATIRIVKGANMEMERVEASLMGWAQAPFMVKRDTDANYKRMLHYGMADGNIDAVRLGIASHNLFDVSYGLVLADEMGVLDKVQFEMLEGMANHQRRALFELVHNVLLYAPACRQEELIHAIGYLIRRLDENTGPDNFLSHAFKLALDSDEWHALAGDFVKAFDDIDTLPDTPRRDQDRRAAPKPTMRNDQPWTEFVNESDTDFSLPHNVDWAESIVTTWQDRCDDNATSCPLVIDGQDVSDDRTIGETVDPSRPGVVVGRYRVATEDDVDAAVACAVRDNDGWRALSAAERAGVLARAAQELRGARADLMGIAMAEGGKVLPESDPEVSEAIDFCEFYGRAAVSIEAMANIDVRGRGVVAVVPPWNFPIAIPCGGVAAALAAGNTVVLKPAPSTVLTAYLLCECFWRAGVSKKTLQFVIGPNETVATRLVTHDDVDAVVFTGGTATAEHLLELKPTMHLLAETGGKNATIVTAMSDRDLAIKHIVHSAFGHAGQKCSATSLLILEAEVYDDEDFREALCDAARSLHVGSAWDLNNRMGPLIRPPANKLEKALKELEPGESWALMPKQIGENACLWSPGIKYGVTPGSVTHTTEFFGPVLGVMRAKNLHEAIRIANATGYGLTSGLHSLDDREHAEWIESLRAGNLYVNRGTTGAIVLRQPFGGMGRSAFGPGIKAGGPNYVVPLMRVTETGSPSDENDVTDPYVCDLLDNLRRIDNLDTAELDRLDRAVLSYQSQMNEEFGTRHDHFRLIGQDNFRLYRPVDHLRIRVHADDTLFDVAARVCAAKLAGCRIAVSYDGDGDSSLPDLLHSLTELWAAAIEFVDETDDELARVIRAGQTDRVRYAADDRVADSVRRAAAESGVYLATDAVLCEGRIELLWYLREQSLCVDYHRYGNLGARARESRQEPR
ncbi:MAG: aldehyde dehydrogenase family protein [Phycisphaera sp.]|nr:aldehyde dehydrogenase family protein [Phycisphaera sp.]